MKAVQPVTWAGMQKPGSGDNMVCGACPTPEDCVDHDACARATPEDYEHAERFLARITGPK